MSIRPVMELGADRDPISVLTLRHHVPDARHALDPVEVRPLIDGRDLLEEIHPEGYASGVREWAGPADERPLAAFEEPRRVTFSEADCGAACCGAVWATVRREGDLVIWSDWENLGDTEITLPELRFDATRYDAELARCAADHTWEQPVDTTARLLEQAVKDADALAPWDCALTGVHVRRDRLDRVHANFRYPRQWDGDGPWLHFELALPLDDPSDPPIEQRVRDLANRLLDGDPRPRAVVRGGTGELAVRLGYRWMP
ncbi:hypothetical protein ACN20G_26300 [Streptomyces sp. BI20]|uniref:hypothetical protein n=1 Tax=Streptomyces sp. BI20 TaxID=3403460 RepID=UPI003C781F19